MNALRQLLIFAIGLIGGDIAAQARCADGALTGF
jgi:hypothetical protein